MFHFRHRWITTDVYHYSTKYFRSKDRSSVDVVECTDAIDQCKVCGKRRRREIDMHGHLSVEEVKKYLL